MWRALLVGVVLAGQAAAQNVAPDCPGPNCATGAMAGIVVVAASTPNADSRAAIQQAIDTAAAAGGGRVLAGSPGQTYLLTVASGTKSMLTSGGAQAIHYALSLPSTVTLDLNGATLKLADAQSGTTPKGVVLVANAVMGATNTDHDLGIEHGTLDQNRTQNADNQNGGEAPAIYFQGVTRASLQDLRVVEAHAYCGILSGVSNAQIGTRGAVICDGSDNDGWHIGRTSVVGLNQQVFDSEIGDLVARNIGQSLGVAGLIGNPHLITLVRGHIGHLLAQSAAAGIKIQEQTQDVTIGGAEFITGTGSNCGFKLQGSTTNVVQRVAVGQVVVTGCTGFGLFISATQDVSIGDYVGANNAADHTDTDVWIEKSIRPKIGSLQTTGAGNTAIVLRLSVEDAQIGRVMCRNPSSSAASTQNCITDGGGSEGVPANASCTAALNPFPCCTGNTTGTCIGHFSSIGDLVVRDDRSIPDNVKRIVDAQANANILVGSATWSGHQGGSPFGTTGTLRILDGPLMAGSPFACGATTNGNRYFNTTDVEWCSCKTGTGWVKMSDNTTACAVTTTTTTTSTTTTSTTTTTTTTSTTTTT